MSEQFRIYHRGATGFTPVSGLRRTAEARATDSCERKGRCSTRVLRLEGPQGTGDASALFPGLFCACIMLNNEILRWEKAMRAGIPLTSVVLAAICALGCAGTIVQPSDLPPRPRAMQSRGGAVVLLLDGVPEPMADEVRSSVGGAGPVREVVLQPDDALRAACKAPEDLVLRPRLGRTHFASNAPDRNSMFIYETAIIVGIPVTLISAVAWKYYAETLVQIELDVLSCAETEPLHHVSSFRLRSEGRGFVRTDTLQDAQYDAALRGVTRKAIAEHVERRMSNEENRHE